MKKSRKVFYYPPCHREGYGNPYSYNYKGALAKKCNLLDADNAVSRMQSLTLLRYSLIADTIILNWPETIVFNRWGKVQFVLLCIALWLSVIKKSTIVWMFHNVHPHEGENWYTRTIQKFLYKHANLIVCHSKEACEYAKRKANCKVVYACHPLRSFELNIPNIEEESKIDVLIWGTVYPYKGITEFISDNDVRESGLSIYIVGKCENQELSKQIESLCNENIRFENRRIDFSELSTLIRQSKVVLFPYVGDSISSSGALIDTIVLGGTPVGPQKGAFADLEDEHVCITYCDMKDCLDILKSNRVIDEKHRQEFVKSNSWDAFADKLLMELN